MLEKSVAIIAAEYKAMMRRGASNWRLCFENRYELQVDGSEGMPVMQECTDAGNARRQKCRSASHFSVPAFLHPCIFASGISASY